MAKYDTIHIHHGAIISVHIRHRDGRNQPSFVNYRPTDASLNRLRRLGRYYNILILEP